MNKTKATLHFQRVNIVRLKSDQQDMKIQMESVKGWEVWIKVQRKEAEGVWEHGVEENIWT